MTKLMAVCVGHNYPITATVMECASTETLDKNKKTNFK